MSTTRYTISGVVAFCCAVVLNAQTIKPSQPVHAGKAVVVGASDKQETHTELVAKLKTELTEARKAWEQTPSRPEQYGRHLTTMQATLQKLCPGVEAEGKPNNSKPHEVTSSKAKAATTSNTQREEAPRPTELVEKGTYLKPDPVEMKRRAEEIERVEAFANECRKSYKLLSGFVSEPPSNEAAKKLFEELAKSYALMSKLATPSK